MFAGLLFDRECASKRPYDRPNQTRLSEIIPWSQKKKKKKKPHKLVATFQVALMLLLKHSQ
jgi:hypothetical protein